MYVARGIHCKDEFFWKVGTFAHEPGQGVEAFIRRYEHPLTRNGAGVCCLLLFALDDSVSARQSGDHSVVLPELQGPFAALSIGEQGGHRGGDEGVDGVGLNTNCMG